MPAASVAVRVAVRVAAAAFLAQVVNVVSVHGFVPFLLVLLPMSASKCPSLLHLFPDDPRR